MTWPPPNSDPARYENGKGSFIQRLDGSSIYEPSNIGAAIAASRERERQTPDQIKLRLLTQLNFEQARVDKLIQQVVSARSNKAAMRMQIREGRVLQQRVRTIIDANKDSTDPVVRSIMQALTWMTDAF